MIDDYIVENSLESPGENRPVLRDGFESPILSELDLQAAGISAVIWAMGHRFDFSLVRLPVVDEAGFPVTESGATRFPGLYFLGMPWMPSLRTGVLLGVGEAAAMIASMIVPGS
jgi:putative flavoprotein involved in K+ transport